MLTTPDIKQLLKQYLYRNIALPYELAYELAVFTLESFKKQDKVAQIAAFAALAACNTKATYASKTGAEQIAGFSAAIFEHDIAVTQLNLSSA